MGVEKWWNEILWQGKTGETPRNTYPVFVWSTWSDRDASGVGGELLSACVTATGPQHGRLAR